MENIKEYTNEELAELVDLDDAIITIRMLPVLIMPAKFSIKDGQFCIDDEEDDSIYLGASECRELAEAFNIIAQALEKTK